MTTRFSFPFASRLVLGLALTGMLAGCERRNPSTPRAETMTIVPNPATLAVNGTAQLTVVGLDDDGDVVDIDPTWSVVAGGGSISTTGLFTAGTATGTFPSTVRATSRGVSATATVIVTAGVLASLELTPTPVTLPVTGTQQYTVVGRDAAGNVVAVTPAFSVVAGGGTINPTGLFTAGNTTGTFTNTVRAGVGSFADSATVTVTLGPLASITIAPDPASVATGGTQQFTAVGRDAGNNVVVMTPTWSTINSGGTINGASGMFTASVTPGTFTNTVRAASGAIADSATVTVTPGGVNPITLGAAAPNGIMAGTAFTCVALGTINADIAISPGVTVTGFPPCVITGVQNLGNAIAEQGQLALTTAYNQVAAMPCPPANAIVANLGGTTKTAGVYCTASGIGVTGTLTLDGGGDPNAVFVFQAGSSLTTAGNIVLINGAQAGNVYWQVGSSATIGTASQWQGNILALSSISLLDNATLLGRALARNGAVSMTTGNTITLP